MSALERLAAWPLPLVSGVALVSLAAGGWLVVSSFAEVPSASIGVGERAVNIGAGDLADVRSHNSSTLVRNPLRPANLAVSNRVDSPRFGCALHISLDAGARFTETPIPIPPGEEEKCFAPDVTFGSDGTLYLAFVTLRGRENVPSAAWLARSTDGGQTLSQPVKVVGPLGFQVRVATDPASPRRVHLTWLQAREVGLLKFTGPGNPIMLRSSGDGGATWGRAERVSSPARGRAVTPVPAVGPGGRIYVLYVDLGDDRLDYEGGHGAEGDGPPYGGHFKLVLARSVDGGATWEESVADDRLKPIGRFIVFFPPYPSIAVDPGSGRVYAGFHDARLGDPDVWVWSLPERGGEWDGPTRVNDTARRDGTSQYMPRLAVAPNGRLDVVYYDRRADPRNVMSNVALQSSFDEGKGFTAAKALSSRAFDSRIGFGSPHDLPELGSRIGLLSDDISAFAVWTDTRSGTIRSNKQDLYRRIAVFSQPARLSGAAENGLRSGALALALAGLGLILVPLISTMKRRRSANGIR